MTSTVLQTKMIHVRLFLEDDGAVPLHFLTYYSIISNRIQRMKPFRTLHPNLSSQDNSKLFKLEINFAEHINQASVRLSFRQQDNRIVISRKDAPKLSPLSPNKSRRDRRAAIQSANVSREKIDVEESVVPRLQFSKEQRNKVKNWHKRTKSNHVQLYEIKEDQMSNFSNSLQNISQEIIEIPFANQIIFPPRLNKEAKGKYGGSLEHRNGSSLQKRVGSPVMKLTFQKKSMEKGMNKQNNASIMKPPKDISIPRPKTKQPVLIALSDFNLKAIKITQGGSIVYLAAHKKTNCIFAIKCTKKKAIKPVMTQFIAELKLGLLLDCPNVAKVYGFFTDGDNFYVIKEYMQEGSICERRRKLGQGEIACQINQFLNGVLSVLPFAGCNWAITTKNISQTQSISKITSIKINPKGTDLSFSEALKTCLDSILDPERKGDNTKDFFETNESIHLNMMRQGSYLLCSFREMLQSILILTENEIMMLWQAQFLRQHRMKALMQEP